MRIQRRESPSAFLHRVLFIGQFRALPCLLFPSSKRRDLDVLSAPSCLQVFSLQGGDPVSAQQPDSVAVDTTDPENTPRSVASVERKSPVRAVLYSAGGTFLLTPLFGPSAGHFYADNTEQAWRSIALRTGGFPLAGVFGLAGLGQIHAGGEPSGFTAANVMLYVVSLHAIYDVVTAWHSAMDYNESHGISARVAPPVGPRGEQAGLALRVSFQVR